MSASISQRGKPVQVCTTDTAEWDIADYGVSETLLEVIGQSLAAVPVSERDLVEGTVRYRQFGEFVVVFHHATSEDAFIVDICGIRPPLELEKGEQFMKALEKLSKLRGAFGV